MNDLHGGPSGPGGERTPEPQRRRGRRARPGAVPDAPTSTGPTAAPAPEPSFDELLAPAPVPYDRDAVFDVEDARRPSAGASVPMEHEHADQHAHQHALADEYVDAHDVDPDDVHPDEDLGYEEEPYAQPLEHDQHEYDDEYDAPARRGRGRRRGRTVAALAICVLLLGGAVYAGWSFLGPIIDGIGNGEEPAADFPGPGTGEVDVVVQPGDTGGAIGDTLLEAGVVASRAAFVAEFTATPEAASLQPGTYRLRSEMKASDALALLLDPASRQSIRVGVPEGQWVSETLVEISEDTGFTVEELQAALADPAVGLPPEAGGDPEGYLFPATYDFAPDVTPVQILTAMVERHAEAMETVGVPVDQRRDVLIRASIVQGEASREEDLAKVARVIQNRLDRGETLGMDSTVGYIVQKRALDLTASDLKTDSPYNTRINGGLPPGPINNPGEAALAAALAPAEGDWLYFVTVDGDTGETVFTADYDEFLAAKQQFQEWLAENG